MSTRNVGPLAVLKLCGLAAFAGCVAAGPQVPADALDVVTVHQVPAASTSQLCTAARDWAALTFRDSKAVVEVFDAAAGKLIGKGRTQMSAMAVSYPVQFSLIVECRDGRARATFSPLTAYASTGQEFRVIDSPSEAFRAAAVQALRRLDADLGAYLKNPRVGGQW